MEKVYTYEIDPTTFQVIIYENKNPLIVQPINPMTASPFADVNEAETFAIEQVLSLYNVADINELKVLRIKYIEQKFAEIINKIIPVDYAVSDITQLLYSLISIKGLTRILIEKIIKAIWYMQALQIVEKKKNQIETLTNINDIVAMDISEEEMPPLPKF